jgi:alkanesulfonate monooxygenase SsuD/methylene tetrahydromethanopterin reductase-like flavin-dependent oxidoreductase (luciferase family)
VRGDARIDKRRQGPAPAVRRTIVPNLKLGILLWSQASSWSEMLDAARRVDRLGYDHLWTWDHVYAIFGDPYQPIFEGYTTLAAWAIATERIPLGLLVGANTLRNPALVSKLIATIDHASGGRAICGLGGAWFEVEHEHDGYDFGSGFGQRLDWLDEAVGDVRALLDGEVVTSAPGGRYSFDRAVHHPRPIQPHVPIMIGGSGERKTLRTVAKYADMWNGMGTLQTMRRKVDVLRRHCEEVGRDPAEIEFTLGLKATIRDSAEEADRVWRAHMEHNRTPLSDVEDDVTFWNGTPEQLAERLAPYLELGFSTAISEMPAPYDVESLERLIGQVKPLVERG